MSFYLGWWDYVVLVVMLALSTSIGIYFGCFGTKQNTTKEYLMGGKAMKVLPIAISVAVSHTSGTTLLGTVADVYRYGASIWLIVVAYIAMASVAIFVFLPIFFRLQVTNIYDYIERRFDRKTRRVAFVIYLLSEVLKFPVHAYTPSLTIATITGINVNLIAAILCLICVFYTSIGGLKTVVWTDFLQFAVIMACLVIACVVGLGGTGGVPSVWSIAKESGRLDVFNFTIDPTARDSFWGYAVGMTLVSTGAIVVHQTGAQKFLSLPSPKECQRSVVYAAFSKSLMHTFAVLIGLVTYSRYRDCDPLTSERISKHDQLFPYFIADIGSSLLGISGLFMATIASASLSSISSDLNALSGVIYKDLVCLFLKEKPPEKRGSNILKVIVLVVGVLCTCLVFAVEKLGEIFSVSVIVAGVTQGPLLGLFALGALFPFANPKGALYGILAGVITVSCVALPAKYYQLKGLMKYPTKPLSVSGCGLVNQTMTTNATLSIISKNQFTQVPSIFKISFYFYVPMGVAMTVLVGLIVSSCTKRMSPVDRSLLSPVVHSCLSKRCQARETVPYNDVEQALQVLSERN